jgi:hypothetical protein
MVTTTELVPTKVIAGMSDLASVNIGITNTELENLATLMFDEKFEQRMEELQVEQKQLQEEVSAAQIALAHMQTEEATAAWDDTVSDVKEMLDNNGIRITGKISVSVTRDPEMDHKQRLTYNTKARFTWKYRDVPRDGCIELDQIVGASAEAKSLYDSIVQKQQLLAALSKEQLQLKVDEKKDREALAREASATITLQRIAQTESGAELLQAIQTRVQSNKRFKKLMKPE